MIKLFYDRLNMIDKVISRGPEACDLSRDVEPYLLEYASRNYFFEHLQDSAWLDLLIRAGKFRIVPEPIQDANRGTTAYPLWPESRYLARMAAHEPITVLEVILQLPTTENIRIHEDIIDAALAMPTNLAVKLVSKAIIWLESPSQLLLPKKLGKLVSHLAQGGQEDEALHLTRSLLAISPDPIMPSELKAHFDDWYYEQILKKQIPDLVATAEEGTLGLLSDLLSDAIHFSRQQKEDEGPEDYSYIWRPAIEDHNQNHPYGLKDMLVSAVRDAAEAMIETKGKVILEIIERKPFKIFQRIGFHLRRKWPNLDPEGTASLASNPNVFDDIHLHHEFYHLLNEQFNNLPLKAQQSYLSMVEKGVDAEKWLDFRERESGHRPSQQEGERYLRRWQYTKLWPIQAFLKLEWQQRFDELKEEFGELDHPDFHAYASTGWVGPTSPKGVKELRSMKMDELITFLKTWKPSGDPMTPSPQGIGRELTNLITSDPAYFAVEAIRFEGLDPTYVHALLSGFRTAKREGNYPWTPIFDLCRWVIDQPRENTGHRDEDTDSDPDWIWTRRAIANLLSDALEPGTTEISFDHRAAVWDVLRPLTEDPDPTPEHEKRYGGSNMDPATLSINTVRGEAMHASVRYALWVRRHLEKAADGKKRISRGFDEIAEVREVLDHHLDPSHDSALAIRAVYGQWFPWLIKLDPQWVVQNIENIFPPEEPLQKLHDAAWETYITFCVPYDAVFDLLREEYSRAIDRIGTFSSEGQHIANPDERLVEHLMTYYWRGKLNINEPEGLLARLYAKAPDSLRIYALDFVGRSLYNTKDTVKPKILKRLQALWELRIKTVRETKPIELISFGWWFASAKFDDGWAISQLKNVLELTGDIRYDDMVVARLATLSMKMPLLTVECLALLLESDEEGWHIQIWNEHARTILSAALQSTDENARQIALNQIDRLGARNNLAFRDLLSIRES